MDRFNLIKEAISKDLDKVLCQCMDDEHMEWIANDLAVKAYNSLGISAVPRTTIYVPKFPPAKEMKAPDMVSFQKAFCQPALVKRVSELRKRRPRLRGHGQLKRSK